MPVGPDTSRLISEIVASAIDLEINKKLSLANNQAARYVDDFTIAVSADQSGESIIAAVRQSAGIFQLELNNDKSKINSSSSRLDIGWKQAIKQSIPKANLTDENFQKFFYDINQICSLFPEKNIEKFALTNARSALVKANSWRKIQSNLINAYRRNSSLVSFLVEILILRNQQQDDVEIATLAEFLTKRMPTLARENRTGEVIWFLFLCGRLKVKLPSACLSELYEMENSLIAILIAKLNLENLIEGKVDFSLWNQSLNQEGLRSSMWLYAYEGVRANLLPKKVHQFVKDDPFFSLLLAKNVGFLSIDTGFESLASRMQNKTRSNILSKRIRDDFFDDFGIDIDEFDEDIEFEDYVEEEYDVDAY